MYKPESNLDQLMKKYMDEMNAMRNNIPAPQPRLERPAPAPMPAPMPTPYQSTRNQPMPNQPMANQPMPNRPMPSQPMANQPMPNQPMANQPMPSQPMPNQSMANQPMPNQPMPNQPMPNQPMANQPMPNQPMPNQPMPNQPMPNQPMPNQPTLKPAVTNYCFDKALEQLNSCGPFTDSFGRPVPNDQNMLTVGPNGPAMMEDIYFVEKLAHFDRERIPERVVHAKGAGAFGEFVCENSMTALTRASAFSRSGKRTKVFTRFSTVIGSKGSADTARDPRGFAVKFYTDEGNMDIVGNNLPVFFIRDAIKFPDVIHSLKPSPQNNIRNAERFWDFISLTPEATHMITWLYSDQGTFKSFRHMNGFGVNTYVWVNADGNRHLVKYHWKTMQGYEPINRHEAERLAGANPDVAVQDLYDAICKKDYPQYRLYVQTMPIEDADKLDFDPLDDTKTWSEEKFPLQLIGTMTLNENPTNFFAQTEQAAFCPANLVPGIELSADKMLQGRSFSYNDTQRYRLGANFADLPINKSIVPVNNNQRDGAATHHFNKNPINYYPNSLNSNCPTVTPQFAAPPYKACGEVARQPIVKTNDFVQAGEKYASYTPTEKEHLCDNIAVELAVCRNDIVERVLSHFGKASKEFENQVRQLIHKYRS